jgi:hypothetical protein
MEARTRIRPGVGSSAGIGVGAQYFNGHGGDPGCRDGARTRLIPYHRAYRTPTTMSRSKVVVSVTVVPVTVNSGLAAVIR